MEKICQECGLPFETKSGTKKFCDRQHYRICRICGEEFPVTYYHLTAKDAKTTCSKKCASIARKRTNEEKYGGPAPACSDKVQEKIKQTSLEKYGTERPQKSDKVKDTMKQSYRCKYENNDEAKELMRTRYKATMQSRYGVSVPLHSPSLKAKSIQTSLDRYGTSNPMQNPSISKKVQETYYRRTGYLHPFQNPEVQNRMQSNSLEKYGVEHPQQSPDIREKIKASLETTFGDPSKKARITEKRQNTCISRYGVDNFMKTEEGRAKVRKSLKDKFGVEYFSQSEDWKTQVISDPSKVRFLMEFDDNPKRFILENFEEKPALLDIASLIGVSGTEAVSLRIHREGLEDLVNYVYSQMEHDVFQYLQSLDLNTEIIRNTKSVITPYELDLYLPEYNFAIECNPVSTHNSTINMWEEDKPPLPYNYHKSKTEMCENKGIFLFHIFGYEWAYKQEIIKSMLRNILRKNLFKIYARNTQILEVNSKDASKFLNDNHRQGSSGSSVKLGLYLDGELVSLMTFGKMRKTIGTGLEDLDDCWELIRFCNVKNTTVIGGASKLFSYFIEHWNPKRIRSFSDRAHTRGTLYDMLGFNIVRISEPGYVWVGKYTEKPIHRVNAQKRNLVNLFKDSHIDMSKSERQIMEEHNFVRVFDSGTITWEWVNLRK